MTCGRSVDVVYWSPARNSVAVPSNGSTAASLRAAVKTARQNTLTVGQVRLPRGWRRNGFVRNDNARLLDALPNVPAACGVIFCGAPEIRRTAIVFAETTFSLVIVVRRCSNMFEIADGWHKVRIFEIGRERVGRAAY
jgi:hypothetical protein